MNFSGTSSLLLVRLVNEARPSLLPLASACVRKQAGPSSWIPELHRRMRLTNCRKDENDVHSCRKRRCLI